MLPKKVIEASNEKEIWDTISYDFAQNPDMLQYAAIIHYNNTSTLLDIDVDPGGGFESGFETTTLLSKLPDDFSFRFAIHEETFIDEIGKFLGMQDVKTGVPEFDNKYIVKANDEAKVKKLFSNATVSDALLQLNHCTLEISNHKATETDDKSPYLEYRSSHGIFNTDLLQQIYSAYLLVLKQLSHL